MKNMKRSLMPTLLFLAISSLVLLPLLFGCSSGSDALTIWQTMDPAEIKTFNTIMSNFREAHPDIPVEVQLVPFNDAREKYSRAAQGGNAPDVLRCEIAWTPLFADRGFLKAIEKHIPPEELNDYLDAPLNYNKFQGHLWGIPQVTDCLALLYNKRLLNEAGVDVPKTMDELLAAAKKLTDKANDRYGIFIPADGYFLQPFIWGFGGGLISNNKEVLIDNEKSIQGLEFFLRLKKAAMPEEVAINTQNKERDEGFKSGKYAMVFQGPWATSDLLLGKEFKDNPENLGIAVIPKGPGGYGSPVGGHNYVISKDSKKTKEAITLIRFLNKTEHQVMLATRNNLLPTRQSAYDTKEIQDNRLLQGFKRQLDVANNRPVIPEGGQIYPNFTKNFQKAFQGDISAKKALEQTAKEWQELINN